MSEDRHEAKADTTETAESQEVSHEEIIADARDDALDFLEGLLESMDLDGDVEAEINERGDIEAKIDGEDIALLIGRHGQTLDAVQELLRTVVQRQAQTRVRVSLDIQGYRERKREALRLQAHEWAEQAKDEGELELEPMTSYERKIVHDAVAEVEGVTSKSEGEDPDRRIILTAE